MEGERNPDSETKRKKYQDFLEILLCLHPDVQKPVNNENVLIIVYPAEEYQASLITERCKEVMLEWLQSELNKWNANAVVEKLRRARTCLKVLATADSLSYDKVVEESCKVLGRFGHTIFTGYVPEDRAYPERPSFTARAGISSKPDDEDPLADCKDLFNKLPKQLKYNLLLERLSVADTTDMK